MSILGTLLFELLGKLPESFLLGLPIFVELARLVAFEVVQRVIDGEVINDKREVIFSLSPLGILAWP